MDADWLFTNLARALKLRKALIQAPVLWELRKLNPLDALADEAVKAGSKDDCSTGWGQIFAWVTIAARNYCMDQGIIHGTPLTGSDTRAVWDNLQEPEYNIPSVAYLTIYNAHQLGIARPSLTTSQADSEKLLARYNSTGDKAEKYGRELIGLYNVLENYNKLSRAQQAGLIVENERMRKLCVPVVVNLLLGVPAVVPLFLAWYILANGPLAAVGWTMQDPNENDGMLLWLVIAAPVFFLFGLAWGLANTRLRRRTPVRGSRYWPVCAAASLAPFFVVFGLF